MREIVLDTETTGLDPDQGDRVVEIGCVELMNHTPTGKTYQCYYNPERAMSQEATRITGLTSAFLRDKPLFADRVDAFLDFIGDAKLVMHNAEFDMKFLNNEMALAGRPPLDMARVVDTLPLAQRRYAGLGNSLDALCRRYAIDLTERDKHGALLDSELLAAVYLELIGGRQPGLVFQGDFMNDGMGLPRAPRQARPTPLPPRLTAQEHETHIAFLNAFPKPPKWLGDEAAGDDTGGGKGKSGAKPSA